MFNGVAGSTAYYHEGFFWKCDCVDQGEDDTHLMWKLWLSELASLSLLAKVEKGHCTTPHHLMSWF